MTHDDPFGLKKARREPPTVYVKPTPGRSEGFTAGPADQHEMRSIGEPTERFGINPLETAASMLLAVMTRLRNTQSHPNPKGLRAQLLSEFKAFEENALHLGVRQETVHAASYVLKTALDEVVLNQTAWGISSVWRREGLGDVLGGERFFTGLERLLADPTRHIDLLEIMYICLSLGFEGRYRAKPAGREQLRTLQEDLYNKIRRVRGEPEAELSCHWQPFTGLREPHSRIVPVWVVGVLACALLIPLFWFLDYKLDRASDPTFSKLMAIGHNIEMVGGPPDPNVMIIGKEISLREILEPEIANDEIEITEEKNGAKITILAKDLFASGSESINSSYLSLLSRISDALQRIPGRVLVIGHTDNVPIFTEKFRSNWRLSEARAQSVMKVLVANTASPERFHAKGLADTDPLVPNDSPENRARNRRVELLVSGGIGSQW